MGTVTLLFSDIEGSTRLAHALGDAWPELLARHRRVCRTAWGEHGGHELATEGDSFFVVFADAREAVAAAVLAQRRLAATAWPQDAEVRVRIGLHTGTPVRLEDGYAGLDVHRGARIAAAAHGGQVLVSGETRAAASLTSVRDLGWHELRDLLDRIQLFQVEADGLTRDFPPIRSRGTVGGLPVTDGPIVGREAELAELTTHLVRDRRRLVTLTGPGGTGKTRLAIAVAADLAGRYAGGVHFIPLTAATDAAEAWSGLGRALDLAGDPREQLADLEALLVLDNLEQCADADGVARELLDRAPGVALLATSRRALHVPGERELQVAPLDLADGVALFETRASGLRRELPRGDVEELVRRLDRMPLAIEIAAARMRVLGPAALLSRLDDLHQRTMRSTIAWSYDLLADAQQRLLDCLGLFVDGAPLAAVEAMARAEGIADPLDQLFGLVDASLVQASETEDGEPRFHLLETVRIFALARLDERGVRAQRESARAQYFYDIVARDMDDRQALEHKRQRAEFLREIPNLRAVLERGAAGIRHEEFYGDRPVPPNHVVVLFAVVARIFNRFEESRAWEALVVAGDAAGEAALRLGRGTAAAIAGDTGAARVELAAARELAQTMPPLPLPIWTLSSFIAFLAQREITHTHLDRGEIEQARAAHAATVALADLERFEDAAIVHELGAFVAITAGDLEEALAHYEREGAVIREHGVLREVLLWSNNVADLEVQMGKHTQARMRLAEHCEAYLAQGDVELLHHVLATFAGALAEEDPARAARAHGAVRRLQEVEGLVSPGREQAFDDALVAGIRDRLGQDAWTVELAAGAACDAGELIRELSR